MEHPKIAVTAANGSLGTAIIRHIIREKGRDHVLGIARNPEKAKHIGVEIKKGDYKHRKDFDQSLSGMDTLLLVSGMDDPRKRVQQHRNVIDAAREAGVRKIVYTSIIGSEKGNDFSPIVQSNRQTEEDIKTSGLEWVIGRNGLYIEPDLEYIDTYVKEGGIVNCAGEGKCAYTSRSELAYAYWHMLAEDKHNGNTYNLLGEPITQSQLADLINQVYHTRLTYAAVSKEEYLRSRQEELGDFLGTVISGIYEGISKDVFTAPSDYEQAAGRKHLSALEMIRLYKKSRE
jgi:NAD(P)H dehydrogenase (quinone)